MRWSPCGRGTPQNRPVGKPESASGQRRGGAGTTVTGGRFLRRLRRQRGGSEMAAWRRVREQHTPTVLYRLHDGFATFGFVVVVVDDDAAAGAHTKPGGEGS